MDNPVYYVQYGHARIACDPAQGRVARASRCKPIADADLSLLTHEAELDLLRALAEVPGQIARRRRAARAAPLAHAAQDLAAPVPSLLHGVPRGLRRRPALTQARLWLAAGTKQVIANLLGLLGVSAPESMERVDG